MTKMYGIGQAIFRRTPFHSCKYDEMSKGKIDYTHEYTIVFHRLRNARVPIHCHDRDANILKLASVVHSHEAHLDTQIRHGRVRLHFYCRFMVITKRYRKDICCVKQFVVIEAAPERLPSSGDQVYKTCTKEIVQ